MKADTDTRLRMLVGHACTAEAILRLSAASGENGPTHRRSHADILDLLVRELQLIPVDAHRVFPE